MKLEVCLVIMDSVYKCGFAQDTLLLSVKPINMLSRVLDNNCIVLITETLENLTINSQYLSISYIEL